ncbi:glycosyltransferase family 2 protein [Kitasatospora brasiliensis]|uniref:glycosyltransferase family 2 protein n=1 Tax=Kitasatospora brasiliensis TaxID=3058040 RepID=UPI0029307BD9|nr:glycosyltransferase family 2 protein [Kitasatospora sp. K002]
MGVTLGVVVLTMGDRPAELTALLDSVRAQDGSGGGDGGVRTVVLGQGAKLPELPDWVDAVELPENLGIPGGRNVGVERLRELGGVDVVVDLDDDGLLPRTDTFRLLREAFERDPGLGIVSFRVADETGHTQRRHVPRLGASDPLSSGPVTTFLGLFPAEFFYAHEETDLAWRALDAGWRIDYRADLLLQHPRTDPARHTTYYRLTARNRVWLAKRHLPAILVPVYLTSWTLYTLLRRPPLSGLRAWWSGLLEGVRTPCPPRRPMRWSTVWRMTRLGRPPVF